MIATRTDGWTAMVSRISVSPAPISVVIALSACGRLSVIRAICSPAAYSRSTGEAGSSPSTGGPKSRVFQRSVGVVLVATGPLFRSGLELREPAERAQAGGKAVLAAAGDDERRQLLKPAPDRPVRDRQRPGPVVRSDERVLLGGRADGDAVVEPLRLDELELAVQVGADEDEDDAAVGPVVLELARREHRPVARATADHAMEADVGRHLAVQRVARVRPACVRARGTLEAAEIVAVGERVVPLRIRAECGIVVLGRHGKWRATWPAADHLGAHEGLVRAAGGLRPKVLPVGGHARVELAEHHVGPVAPEHLRRGHGREAAGLVGVAEDELSGLDRRLVRIASGGSASLARVLADPFLEAERRPLVRQLVAVLAPDHLDPAQ